MKVNAQKLQEMIKEAISDYVSEAQPGMTASQRVKFASSAANPSLKTKDRNVTVTQSQLKEMVAKVVKSRLMEFDAGNNPIMDKREIIALMDTNSRNFEHDIIKTFNLQNPDTLAPELQRRYLEIVEGMKAELVGAAMKAVQELINFPSNDAGNAGLKK
jgi:hypothetical protein